MKNKNIHYIAEANDDKTQPKNNNVGNRQTDVVDPDAKAQTRNKIVK
jgi:hypothetical protein